MKRKILSLIIVIAALTFAGCSGIEDTAEYSKGDRLLVKGRISGINRNCIYILNLYGSPGYPNYISVEKLQ